MRSIGCPIHLSELGIEEVTEEALLRYAEDTLKVLQDEEGRLPGRPSLRREYIVCLLCQVQRGIVAIPKTVHKESELSQKDMEKIAALDIKKEPVLSA